jgi:ribosomal protein S18 acetylase RimI-like enzyme
MSNASNDPRLIEGGPELLDWVEPLWTELRHHHAELSPIWRTSLMAASFDKRRAGLLEKSSGGMLVLLTSAFDKDIGYCVSTVNNSVGEIDSIFVVPTHRGDGVGHLMMTRAMEWLAQKAVTSIVVDVLSGNDAAQAFYARYGFQPRTVRLLKMCSVS